MPPIAVRLLPALSPFSLSDAKPSLTWLSRSPTSPPTTLPSLPNSPLIFDVDDSAVSATLLSVLLPVLSLPENVERN
jgi:hypothetical protein